ncbi:MAG: PilN domain-containing protein [Gammaproteobacteria bacterium]
MKSSQAIAKRGQLSRILDFGGFLHWWGTGLKGCLPGFIRDWLSSAPARLVIDLRDDEIVLAQEEGGKWQVIGRYPPQALDNDGLAARLPKTKDKMIVLRLPSDKALAKPLTLPLAAEANLRQVVGFEVDRLTPFAGDKVYYHVHVVERQPANRTLRADFVMVLRAVLDPVLSALNSAGLAPDAVTVQGGDPRINLLPPEKRPRKGQFARWLQRLLAVAVLALAAIAVGLPLWQQRAVVIALMPKADAVQRQAEAVLALRKQLDESIESSRFVQQKRASNALMIDVLRELTIILPDHTWLEQIDVRGNELQIRGQSQEASTLVGLVDGAELFENATFRSPVTRDGRTGRDRFFLAAQIVAKPAGNTKD